MAVNAAKNATKSAGKGNTNKYTE